MTVPKQLLDSLTKSAKSLVKAVRRGDIAARDRVQQVYRDLPESTLKLMQAQHVLAVELGYRSWADLREAPESEVRGAMGRIWKKRRLDRPTQARIREIFKICGVTFPPDMPINFLSLCRITGGESSTLRVAQEQARERARLRQWSLSIARDGCVVENHQGARIEAMLRDEGIPFLDTWTSTGHYYSALQHPDAYPQHYAEICETFGPPVE